MNPEDHYVRLDGLLWFPVDGGSWIVRNMEEDKFYNMQEDGKKIFELLDGSRSVNEIIEIVCKEESMTREEATKQITEFFENLLNLGLVLPVDKMKED